jgi:hypothetical protein
MFAPERIVLLCGFKLFSLQSLMQGVGALRRKSRGMLVFIGIDVVLAVK